jgi:uncharacterized protein (DUF1800 family)
MLQSRREFLRLPRPQQEEDAPNTVRRTRRLLSGLNPYSGTWGQTQIVHTLKRLMFGAKQEDILFLATLPFEKAIEKLLVSTPSPMPPVNDYNHYDDYDKKDYVDKYVPWGKSWVDAKKDDQIEYFRNISMKGWWLRNLMFQDLSIQEKIVVFWHNHLPVEMIQGIYDARFSYKYLDTIRTHSLGNFKAMIKAITIDPAMLFYLNGTYNDVYSPDENYARELQELFCIGKGANPSYTEDDVKAAARVLTGWKADYVYPKSYFNEFAHDTKDKQFSAFYGNKLIKGKSGQAGKDELDELLDMIFANNEVALFVCRKLYRFFVSHIIDADVEANVIAPLAAIFRQNNYEIKPVLDTLFKSDHFFDTLIIGSMMKTPLDFAIGQFREMRQLFPDASELRAKYEICAGAYYWMSDMLLEIGEPPNVAGYPAYYQSPQFDKYWISTSTLPKRGNYGDNMIWGGHYGRLIAPQANGDPDYFRSYFRVLVHTESLLNPDDPNTLLDETIAQLFVYPPSTEAVALLKSILLDKQMSDYYWTNAWNDYKSDPTNDMKKELVKNRLKPMYQYLFQLEEYQLM